MKKFKIGASIFLLFGICIFCQKFLLLVNYLLALILHELAHVFVAIKRGYKVKYVHLSMFGLAVELDAEIDNKDAFAINLAGPMFNLILCVLCLACYTIFPQSNKLLNNFCTCNLVLSFFNLLPVYPLDGGKIFKSIFKTNKSYKVADMFVRVAFTILFASLFICSIVNAIGQSLTQNVLENINWFYLLFALFFAISKPKTKPNFSLFKTKHSSKYEKIEMLKVDANETLFDLLKHISNHHYTIFYCAETRNKYFDEDSIVSLSLKFPLTTTIGKVD